MKVPDRFNYAEVYLTFKCGLGCDYCINKFGGLEKRTELTGKEWIKHLNNLDINIPITLGGGEPTKHPDFFEIVQGVKHPIDLLTNLQFDIEKFIKKVNPNKFSKSDKQFYHPIRISYHAQRMDKERTIADAKRLQNAGFNVGLFGIRHPHVINDNMEMAFLSAKAGVPFYEKDFLGKVDGRTYGFYKYPEGLSGEKKPVLCRTRELLVAPDGNIFRCHRDLYLNERPVGDIKDKEIKDIFRPCGNFGDCNPCDLKLKTNKYLESVECQVEIK